MKQFLARFRISNCLDDNRPADAALRRQMERDPSLRRYHDAAADLDARLKQSRGTSAGAKAPADLHASIMREVRRASVRPRPSAVNWRPVLAGVAVVIVVLAAAAILMRQPQKPRDVVANNAIPPELSAQLATARVLAQQFAAQAAENPATPLDTEVANLKQDIRDATEFLLSKIPSM